MGKATLAIHGGPRAVQGKTDRWPPIGDSETKAVLNLMQKAELSYYGREGVVEELENAFAAYHDVEFALALSSGTAALHSAFFACGIGPGDEVIAPTYTFLATVTPILATNGVPVLVDSEEDTGNIDPAAVEAAITDRTRALVVTHIWGHPVEMDAIMAIARRHGLKVIEDCSHAHGATYRGMKVGTFGDVACFSLQAKKIVAAGQGGMLITRDREIFERAVLFGHFRVRSEQEVHLPHLQPFTDTGLGLNYRMHPLAAAIALPQFRDLDRRIELRGERLERLSMGLAAISGITPPVTRAHVTRGGWYGYKPAYQAEELGGLSIDTFVRALQAEGVQIDRPGSAPLHLSALFAGADASLPNFTQLAPTSRRAYRPGDLPVSERVFAKSLSLPTFTFEPFALVDEYVAAVAKVAAHADELLDLEHTVTA